MLCNNTFNGCELKVCRQLLQPDCISHESILHLRRDMALVDELSPIGQRLVIALDTMPEVLHIGAIELAAGRHEANALDVVQFLSGMLGLDQNLMILHLQY